MLITKDCFPEMINARAREIGARVELFEGSTLLQIFYKTDALKSFKIERIGDNSKFFGFGICQKLEVVLLDKDRKINITKAHSLEVEFGVGCEYMYPFPIFDVEEVKRNENTNELTIVAYDRLYNAASHFVQEIEEKHGTYTILDFAEYCGTILGLPIKFENVDEESFETLYPKGANFEGTENLREALDDIAEATQTIYYINNDWELTFKRLDAAGEPVLTISKDKYFELDSGEPQTLTTITHATELGDNLTATTGVKAATQYVRNNAFWELREDLPSLVDKALAVIGGITITPFTCSWRGNFVVEIGDKIGLIAKDDTAFNAYLLNDSITYDGGMREETEWVYGGNEAESPSNPTNIGDAIKQTYARVDKVNKTVEIVASEVEENAKNISSIQMDTESINASVKKVETELVDNMENVNSSINTLTNTVDAKMTAEDVSIAIQKEMANGVDKVITSTGFTFDEKGLTVSKTGTDITTTITEDGMIIRKKDEELLIANNEGVIAIDLHAKTYLIIGNNSRIEDFNSNRTGVFWIGG